MQRPRRIVNYAVNGIGAGHVMRLIAINRWLRRHAAQSNISTEIFFLTSSEAASLLFAEGFPTFKLPSRTAIAESEIDEAGFLELVRPLVGDILSALNPDLLVVDTFPQGYFEELDPFLESCPKAALVYRPLKEVVAGRKEFQNALSRYSLVLVPEYEPATEVLAPPAMSELVRYIGPIIVRERDEVFPRDEARRTLGIHREAFAIYISVGGGGDKNAERLLSECYETLVRIPDVHLVIGAGPLYRGRCFYGPRVTWLAHSPVVEYIAAFDVAVSAAGYNSFNELMHFGVPTVFLPQEKWADDQNARAERAARAGAAVVLASNCDAFSQSLVGAVEQFRDPAQWLAASRAGRDLVPDNHARHAALALLGLHS
jgi:UDP-N-acetylglucosamine--N-acetylmuramyl-(pentapeptide) pyrophosphoryl-undecaprenol N-acetylglucosamine transferase